MLQTTTIEDKKIVQYFGIVSGETIIGANIFKDFMASIRDIIGGQSESYETIGANASMLMITATGTAVCYE